MSNDQAVVLEVCVSRELGDPSLVKIGEIFAEETGIPRKAVLVTACRTASTSGPALLVRVTEQVSELKNFQRACEAAGNQLSFSIQKNITVRDAFSLAKLITCVPRK